VNPITLPAQIIKPQDPKDCHPKLTPNSTPKDNFFKTQSSKTDSKPFKPIDLNKPLYLIQNS
jgi:hypothetical protein